jgi:hypothetical protein
VYTVLDIVRTLLVLALRLKPSKRVVENIFLEKEARLILSSLLTEAAGLLVY